MMELINKHKDIDPYDEEMWEDEENQNQYQNQKYWYIRDIRNDIDGRRMWDLIHMADLVYVDGKIAKNRFGETEVEFSGNISDYKIKSVKDRRHEGSYSYYDKILELVSK